MKHANRIIINTLLLSVFAFSGHSQIPVLGSESLLDKLRLNKGISGDVFTLYSNINGYPYLFKDFTKGKLVVNNGAVFNVNVRYDMYANQMHLKDKEDIYAITHPEKIMLIETDSLKFVYSRYVKSTGEETNKDSSYFILKTDGKCLLLIKKNIRIQDSEPPKLYQDAKPPKFIITNDTYYLKFKNISAVRIKNEKELLNVLNDQNQKMIKFIRTNKIGVKKIEDLVKVVDYYNGL